jgi:predicted permease
MAQAAVPMMLLLLGVQLARIDVRGHLRHIVGPISLSAALRLLVPPLLCLLLAPLLGVSGMPRNVVLLQLSMPTAVTAALLATEFGSDVQFVSAAILISTLIVC